MTEILLSAALIVTTAVIVFGVRFIVRMIIRKNAGSARTRSGPS